MSITEWIVNNWEAVSLLINAVLAILYVRQQGSLNRTKIRLTETETLATTAGAEAERVKTQAQGDLEEVRNQGAQMLGIIELFREQMVGMGRLVKAIEERNEIQRIDSQQHAKVVDGAISTNARVIELITQFQDFSREQHVQTRTDVGGKVDTVATNVQAARDDLTAFRQELNGQFKRLAPSLQHRFESSERKLDEALTQLPDTDKLNPASVPASDPSQPDDSSGDAAA